MLTRGRPAARGGRSTLSIEVASLRCDDEKDAMLATRTEGDRAGVSGARGRFSALAANASALSLCLLGGGSAVRVNCVERQEAPHFMCTILRVCSARLHFTRMSGPPFSSFLVSTQNKRARKPADIRYEL